MSGTLKMKYINARSEWHIKDFDPEKPGSVFQGYASIFETPDLCKEIAVPGCLTKYLGMKSPGQIKVLYQHQKYNPIGHIKKSTEDSKGWYVDEGWIDHTIQGKDTALMMSSGTLSHLSFGYLEKSVDSTSNPGFKMLKELDPWEVSPVTWSMHPDAEITGIKGLQGLPEMRSKDYWDLYSLLSRSRTAADLLLNPDKWQEQANEILLAAARGFRTLSSDLYALLGIDGEADAAEQEAEEDQDESMQGDQITIELSPEEKDDIVERLNDFIGYASRLGSTYQF